MKLAGIWTIYDGEELLEGSVKQIRQELDRCIFVYQQVSNYGNPISNKDIVYEVAKKYNAEVHIFSPKIKRDSHYNQRMKLMQALDIARTDCSHFIYLATDEYFDTWEFIKAKQMAEQYDTTVVQMYNYFMKPEYKLLPIMSHVSPFISRIPQRYRFDTYQYPDTIDPSRCLCPIGRYHKFDEKQIVKHHYSWVRKDIGLKIENHGGLRTNHDYKKVIEGCNSWKYGDPLPFFKGKSIQKVDNKFGIFT